ncbi:MAG: penicillin acylase family protein [Planctomycetota bacterium]|nr:penicillin acylase family protein [Planctomycetota bacterium]
MAQRVAGSRRPLDGLLAAVGKAAAPALRALSRRAILPLEGALDLPGLQGEVEVHMDGYGIPHVRAGNDPDAFRVQGFLHARDRFFQMDIMRRVLRGGLAAVVGERSLGRLALPPFGEDATTVDADRLMRVFDLAPSADRVWAEGSPEGRALLTAYVEGVNHCIERLRRGRPLEHRLLGLPLEAWKPTDSILVAKGMALGLAFKWRAAPVIAAIADRLKDAQEHLDRILPPVPGEDALAHTRFVAEGLAEALRFVPPAPPTGSNAWMVGRGRTASGKPLVASDPHLELSLPAIWYLASLHGPRYQAVGCSLPGLPGVVIGRTPTIAWALTNGMLDDCDLWTESLDEGGGRYRLDGVWEDLACETQTISVKGGDDVLFRVRRTHRGALLTDAFPGYRGPAFSLRMALHEPTRDLDAFLGLGRSRTVADAMAAARTYGSPAQNLLVADAHGDAAYRLIGFVPRRSIVEHPSLPRDGSTRASDWDGWARHDELPHRTLGPADEVVSANHPPADGAYPLYLSHLYEPDYRAERIAALLAGREDLTRDDMLRMQSDTVCAALGRFRRAVLDPYLDEALAQRPTLTAFAEAVRSWDGAEAASDRGGVPWHLLYHHLVLRVFEAKLGTELCAHWMGVLNLVDAALLDAFENEANPWAPPAERARLLGDALEAAEADLHARGLALDAPWGSFHTLALKHPAGAAAPLAATFNPPPFPADGGPFSVVSGQYLHARPGPVIAGQSYRHAIDLGDPQAGRMITFGGQSGHVGSPHYADLTPLWRAYDTVPMHLETPPPEAVVVRFVPA